MLKKKKFFKEKRWSENFSAVHCAVPLAGLCLGCVGELIRPVPRMLPGLQEGAAWGPQPRVSAPSSSPTAVGAGPIGPLGASLH